MKNIMDKIEKVHYTCFTYSSVMEKRQHISEMQNKGYELLVNFQNEHQAVFRKFLEK